SLALNVENIKKDLEKSTSGLDDLKTVTETVAFNVMDAVSYTGTKPIIFSNILLNDGNAYNNVTGIFTAPTTGIYQFNAHVCGLKSAEDIEYYIKVGSNVIVTGEFEVPERATDTKCTSFSAVALARKGDHVLVGGSEFSKLDYEENDLSSFSGVLIRAV
ncbi:EMILIN-2-like, partial [Ruditapes philippinarum]|uniref:EMILIN-2-like n=1 Tax=Ruditapes philippinarum TaxID=129788 RepID=UPI00295B2F3B